MEGIGSVAGEPHISKESFEVWRRSGSRRVRLNEKGQPDNPAGKRSFTIWDDRLHGSRARKTGCRRGNRLVRRPVGAGARIGADARVQVRLDNTVKNQ